MPDCLITSTTNLKVIVDNNEDILFDISGYAQVIDGDVDEEDRTITLQGTGNWYWIYASLGTDIHPVIGYSTSYGDEPDAVYIAKVKTDTLGITDIEYFRIGRSYESTWRKLVVGEETEEITFSHRMGNFPNDVRVFISAKGGSDAGRDETYVADMSKLIISYDDMKIRISTHPDTTYIYLDTSGSTITEAEEAYIKVILRY